MTITFGTADSMTYFVDAGVVRVAWSAGNHGSVGLVATGIGGPERRGLPVPCQRANGTLLF